MTYAASTVLEQRNVSKRHHQKRDGRLEAYVSLTKVISLSLQQVCWQNLTPVPIEEGKSGRERRSSDTPFNSLDNSASPAGLSAVDSLVEEVVEEQVLEGWVVAEGLGDILEEDGSDNAATAPHESDFWHVKFPLVFLGGLEEDETDALVSFVCLIYKVFFQKNCFGDFL